jgi:hypothetical protein
VVFWKIYASKEVSHVANVFIYCCMRLSHMLAYVFVFHVACDATPFQCFVATNRNLLHTNMERQLSFPLAVGRRLTWP